jgi:PAS domain S-box-containing protein
MKMADMEFPGYEVLSQVHDDAYTAGFKGIRIRDGLPVILKMLKPAHVTPITLSRFHNEYEIAHVLKTDRIVKVYTLEMHDRINFLVCEDFNGTRLDEFMPQWRQSQMGSHILNTLIKIAGQIVAGLADIHAAGVIFKDLHPSGIVFNSNTGVLKISDFGLATTLSSVSPASGNPLVTKSTLAYMSPEQTGRMNRSVDYRTDFYSFGVILYWMLTGRLPFETMDAMELVHAHLAKTPVAPSVLNPAIPPVLSSMVLKLMAKAPEERYQSAAGLKHDLDLCLQQLQEHGDIPSFTIGCRDRAERFMIPEKLYGRETETASLMKAFERAAQGPAELMLVAGFPGIGKTSIINEIHNPITQRRGYFIKGNFDQFKHDTPFSAFVEAFRDLIAQWLSEGEYELGEWRSRILNALGNTGQIIIDVLPELERIIGPQQPVPELSGSAAQNRFYLQFQKFITALCTPEHPLVIVLDDLQWADRSSLELMQLLISRNSINHLLLLGAYRNNEVSSLHPLSRMLDELANAGAPFQVLTLAPLQLSDINQLIADALGCSPEMALPLANLLCRITQGNPFFNNQFLKSLNEEGLIAFDRERGHWHCDISSINALSLTDNVVEFLAIQIQKLPTNTQEILKLAACIGNAFDLATLSIVNQRTQRDTATDLWTAIQAGLILVPSDVAKIFPDDSMNTAYEFDADSPVQNYRFLHERVQQAAYSLIPDEQKKATHLCIARLLLKNASNQEREERLFEIVNQFNRGADLVTDPAERRELAELNLKAGQKAKKAIAYRAAWDYFTVARQLLPEDNWRHQYSFTLSLYESSAEAAYLNGDFGAVEKLVETTFKEALTPQDRVKIFEVQCNALAAQGKYSESLDAGFEFLKSLGVEYPRVPNQKDIDTAFEDVRLAYSDPGIESLIDLPLMKDPHQLAIKRIIDSISPAAFASSYDLFNFLTLKTVFLSIQYGNTPNSAYGYATYSQILCNNSWDPVAIETGYRFGKLALNLVQRLDAKELQCKVYSVVMGFVAHWKVHVRELLPPLLSAYYSGLEVGDFQYAAYAAFLYCSFPCFSGAAKQLSEVQREIGPLGESIRQMKQEVVVRYFQMLQQVLHDLSEGRTQSRYLKGEYFDEEAVKPAYLQANNWIALFDINFHKLQLDVLYGEYRQAVEDADQAKQCLVFVKDLPYWPIFNLFDSLARLAAYRTNPDGNLEELMTTIEANQKNLEMWAHHVPLNCLYKYHLVEAERFRILGDKTKAVEEYDLAIAGAKENDYYRDAAIANELAATHFLEWNKVKLAQSYLEEARSCYARWGAHGKVRQLEQRYRTLLMPGASAKSHETVLMDNEVYKSNQKGSIADTSLDLATAVKASHAIASEIELGPLLMQLMRILLENAGAQRGALVLERYGDWVIEAQADVDDKEIQVLQSRRLQTSGNISASIVYRVARTRTSVVLDDAAVSGEFVNDYYIAHNGIKSVICAPLVNQGKLSGIVYLENNLATHVFTAERLELLNLLSAQMALSLDNARLYQKAQEEIAERKLAETALRESEKRARTIFDSVNDAIIVHEIEMERIVDVNRTACDMYGYTREELLQLNILDLSVDAPPRMNRLNREEPQIFEWRAKDKNGRVFWVEVSTKVATISGRQRVLVVVRNIEERKRMEASLQRSESVLRATMESISDGLLVVTESGRVLHQNSRFGEICSVPEKLRSANDDGVLLEYVLPQLKDPAQFRVRIREIYQSLARTEDVLYLKDGRIIERHSYPLERIDEESALVWLFRDVTERMRAVEQIQHMNEELEKRVLERTAALEAANKELEAFSYSVSHDLRAPLRAIEGYTRILTEDHAPSLNDEGKRFCDVIRNQSQRMSRLIDDLLLFSRLSRTGMRRAPINMEALAHAVFQELTTQEYRARINLRIASLPQVSGDETLLRQVLANLISNAIKFSSKQNRPTIEIGFNEMDAETIYSIHDNGAGFDMQYANKLFGVFQRLHSESEFEGTGVGLAIVQQIINRHGGRVWAEGEVGKGATFYFSLPRKGDAA